MPANVELFRNVTKPASIVYCDTNFLLDLIAYITKPTEPRLLMSRNFFDLLYKNKVACVTSIMGIQELLYIIMFEWGIKVDMKQIADASGNTYTDIRKFKREKPSDYSILYKKYLPKVDKTLMFMRACGIKVVYPFRKMPTSSTLMSHVICNYARLMIKKYEIDVSDAFHIALAKYGKITHIVTSDRGYKQVDGVSLYCPW
jgi:predicted nucleic acid-binding protein